MIVQIPLSIVYLIVLETPTQKRTVYRLMARHSGRTLVFTSNLPCPALNLQLTGDHLPG